VLDAEPIEYRHDGTLLARTLRTTPERRIANQADELRAPRQEK
jgi:hypothetical protein